MHPEWLTSVDHTADACIEVEGSCLAQLFARAAWAMFSLLTQMDAVRPVESWRVEVHAADRETLLRAWLAELNVRHQVDHLLLADFQVEMLSDTTLRATVRGEIIEPQRHTILTEIKGVTYHGLAIREQDGRVSARILFDL